VPTVMELEVMHQPASPSHIIPDSRRQFASMHPSATCKSTNAAGKPVLQKMASCHPRICRRYLSKLPSYCRALTYTHTQVAR
jgi:hypothetical protein